MSYWLDLLLAVFGFVVGWVLADWLGRRYDPRRREPEGGGA